MRRCFALAKAVILMGHRSCASFEAPPREPASTLRYLLIGCAMLMPATLSIEAVPFTWFRPLWVTPASLRPGVIYTLDQRIVRHATSPSEAPRRRPESQHPGIENDDMTSDDDDDNQFEGWSKQIPWQSGQGILLAPCQFGCHHRHVLSWLSSTPPRPNSDSESC
jgi:hypothetical protein